MSKRTAIRHGEVLLFPVDTVPNGTVTPVTNCIVGHSESGHHHVLESDDTFDQIIAANGDLYVRLGSTTRLRHQKHHQQHRDLNVPAGTWWVIKKMEFDFRAIPEPQPDPPVKPSRIPGPPQPTSRSNPTLVPKPAPRAPRMRWVRD